MRRASRVCAQPGFSPGPGITVGEKTRKRVTPNLGCCLAGVRNLQFARKDAKVDFLQNLVSLQTRSCWASPDQDVAGAPKAFDSDELVFHNWGSLLGWG